MSVRVSRVNKVTCRVRVGLALVIVFNLAHLAKLLTGRYILLFIISLMISRRKIISGFAGPILTIFSPNESVLGVDDRSGPLFPISQGTLTWQQIL